MVPEVLTIQVSSIPLHPSAEDIDEGEVILTLTIEGSSTISDEVMLSIFKNPEVFAGENAEMCVGGMMESLPHMVSIMKHWYGKLQAQASLMTILPCTPPICLAPKILKPVW